MKQRITARSVILGLVLSIGHTAWIVYQESLFLRLGMSFTSFMLIHGVIAILFLIMLANSVLKRIAPRLMFSPTEMMVIFCMTTLSAIISGGDLLQNMLPNLLWPYNYSGPTDLCRRLFVYVPHWFIPQNPLVIKEFFTGSHDFWRFFRPDILRPWAVPLCFWGGFLFMLAFTMLCLSSVLRRQWIDNEKLTFPIIELPLTMAKSQTLGEMFGNPLLLIGFIGTATLLSVNCLSAVYPSIPGLNLNIVNIGAGLFTQPPFSGMNPIFVAWWPMAIGLCYLIPLDISFSCWFFYVIIRLSMMFATMQGWRDPWAGLWAEQFPWFRDITSGAWIGMFVTVMWSARSHLARVWHAAMTDEKMPGESKEPMSYRTAVFGAIIGFVVLVLATIFAGVRPHIALLFFTLYFLATIVMTRIYAQIAVPIFELAHLNTTTLMTGITGTSALTPRDATILGHFHWFNRTYRQHPMGHEMESFAFAEKLGKKPRSMTGVVILAVVTGIVVGLLTTMQMYYRFGSPFPGFPSPMGAGAEGWSMMTTWATNPHPPQATTIGAIAVSAMIVIGLAFARNVSFGFPLHPIGYAFACSYAMEYIWAVVLVTWLIKTLVVRYGGLKLYRRSLPFFFGIILADCVVQLTWGVITTSLHMNTAGPYLEARW
jgi:hypothetical protein